MQRTAILALILTGTSVPAAFSATTNTLEAIADARIVHFGVFDGFNYSGDVLSVYTSSSQNNTQRTFIQFDLSPVTLATDERVESATLTLICSTAFGTNPSKPMEVQRVLSPWTETGLSWNNRDATHAWSNGGGDFIGLSGHPYASSEVSPTNGQPVTWDLTRLVDEWVTQVSTNCGLVLMSYDGNFLTFSQRESPNPAVRPTLTVVVAPGPRPIHAEPSSDAVLLWWTGGGILQEKTNLDPAIVWVDSGRPVALSNDTRYVRIQTPADDRFFRLRGTP